MSELPVLQKSFSIPASPTPSTPAPPPAKPLRLVPVVAADIEKLKKVGEETFIETWASTNTAEDMAAYLSEYFSTERLLEEVNNPESFFYFVLDWDESNDDVLGYLKVNFGKAQTELQDPKAMEIQRIYVLAAHQRKWVGQTMYKKAIELAMESKVEYVWLGVWERNHKALSFYRKNGFVEFDKHVFVLGQDVQTDFMMKLIL